MLFARRSWASYLLLLLLITGFSYLLLSHGFSQPDSAPLDVLQAIDDFIPKSQAADALTRPSAIPKGVGTIDTEGDPSLESDPKFLSSKIQTHREYYKHIFDRFYKHRPIYEGSSIRHYPDDRRAPMISKTDAAKPGNSHPVLSLKFLSSLLQVTPSDLKNLKSAHRKVVDSLPKEYPAHLYNGSGIAIVAGGRFMPVMLTSLKLLRKVNPTIPVEVFLASEDEYERDICDVVLPALNAKCMVLSQLLGEEVYRQFEIRGYQYKILSALTSSFEDVILLDADNIPIGDPEEVFTKEPYISTGYVLWPDFWMKTTSPTFYNVSGIELQIPPTFLKTSSEKAEEFEDEDDPNRKTFADLPLSSFVNVIPDVSTESGQVVVNKKLHFRSLLLATYYNLYGPPAYYPLFSQGAAGEGDKETFMASATVLKEPVYQVQEPVFALGYHYKGRFTGTTMIQSNPYDDYKRSTLGYTTRKPRVMFMHNNLPKLNPVIVLNEKEKHFNGIEERVRFYGTIKDQGKLFGDRDVELEIWREFKWMSCDLTNGLGISFEHWKSNNVNITELCDEVVSHVKWLESTTIGMTPIDVKEEKENSKEEDKEAKKEEKKEEKKDEKKNEDKKEDSKEENKEEGGESKEEENKEESKEGENKEESKEEENKEESKEGNNDEKEEKKE